MSSRLRREQFPSESQAFFAERRSLSLIGAFLASVAVLNTTAVILTLTAQ